MSTTNGHIEKKAFELPITRFELLRWQLEERIGKLIECGRDTLPPYELERLGDTLAAHGNILHRLADARSERIP